MKRMLKIGCGGLLIVMLTGGLYVWVNFWDIQDRLTAKGSSQLTIQATSAGGNVYMLEAVGRDGRRRSAAAAASIGTDGVLLVDTLHHGTAAGVRDVLKELGSDDIRLILPTHFHLDHVGGIEVFRQGATVIAHENVRLRLAAAQREFRFRSYPAQPGKLPDQTFTETYSVSFNGEQVRATHFPNAHTSGDAVVYFTGSKVLVTGDIYNGPGRLSTPSTLQGGDPRGLEAALASLLEELPENVLIIPGHGRTGVLSNLDELRAYHRLLTDTIAMIEHKLASGEDSRSISAGGLPERWRDWPDEQARVERWLRDLASHLESPADPAG